MTGLQDHQFVHVADLGLLETEKLFNAAVFELPRLKLPDTLLSRFTAVEFAHLSACLATEVVGASIVDGRNSGCKRGWGHVGDAIDVDGRELANLFTGGCPLIEHTGYPTGIS